MKWAVALIGIVIIKLVLRKTLNALLREKRSGK
jgi:hypothetical protein